MSYSYENEKDEGGSRRLLYIGIGLGVILVAGIAFFLLRGRQAQTAVQTEEGIRAAEIESGTLSVTVNATGKLQAVNSADLSFLVPGEVQQIFVEPGEEVPQGKLLATLNTELIELNVREAEIILALQENALNQMKSGPSDEDLALARAYVGQAAANLNQLTAPPDEYDQRISELQIELARNQLWERQTNRDTTVQALGQGHIYSDIQEDGVTSAEAGIDIAELQQEQLYNGPPAGAVAAAQASVISAQAQLDLLLAGPDDYDLAIAEKRVEQAALSVELARQMLANAEIRAPFAGTVSNLGIEIGQTAAPGLPVMSVVNAEAFELEIDVDEIDIARLGIEQPVEITMDALPGVVLTGRVDRVSPVATEIQGIVTYRVRVSVDPTDAPLREGMTATATVTVDEVSRTLLVPNWAIRIDRRTGEAFVNVRNPDGTVEEVQVTIGLRSNLFSEVLSGLEAGDEVVVSEDGDLSFFGGQ